MSSAWLRRNVFHPCEGGTPPPRHILGDAGLADLDAELEKLSMDPWRSNGLAMLISRISRRISNGTVGRPQR